MNAPCRGIGMLNCIVEQIQNHLLELIGIIFTTDAIGDIKGNFTLICEQKQMRLHFVNYLAENQISHLQLWSSIHSSEQ
ncbi:hypothetical protein D3C76_1223410 [compost metagenome]